MAGESVSAFQISAAAINDASLVRVAYEDGSLGPEPQLCLALQVDGKPKNLTFSCLDAHRLVNLVISALATMGSPQAVELERIIHRMVRRQLEAAQNGDPT